MGQLPQHVVRHEGGLLGRVRVASGQLDEMTRPGHRVVGDGDVDAGPPVDRRSAVADPHHDVGRQGPFGTDSGRSARLPTITGWRNSTAM